jgi:hypothetical protein
MKSNQVSLGKGESFGFPFFLSVSRGSGSGSQTLKTKDSQARFRFAKFLRIAELDYPSNSYTIKSNNLIKEDKSCVIIKFLTMCQEVLTIRKCLFRVVEPTLLEAWHCVSSMKRSGCIASPRAMNQKIVSIMIGKKRGSCPFFYLCFPSVGSRVASLKTKDSQARFRFVKFLRVAIIKLDSMHQKI